MKWPFFPNKYKHTWVLKRTVPAILGLIILVAGYVIMINRGVPPGKAMGIMNLTLAVAMIVCVLYRYFFSATQLYPVSVYNADYSPARQWTETELTDFYSGLQQVVAWTALLVKEGDIVQNSYGKVFRRTNPEVNGIVAFDQEQDPPAWRLSEGIPSTYRTLLKAALEARKEVLPAQPADVLCNGRLLVFYPTVYTTDMPLPAESKNYLDNTGAPPIDTWFYFREETLSYGELYCWVPSVFEQLIDELILTGYEAYSWLDEKNLSLYKQVILQGGDSLGFLR
ncbi:hypothetical protein ACDQ55_03290 [Chitinophaga sp. 30R24]|uniref:hypothetical protein n=1 Tax=Chitinophaga sp. 30R24 TaxID=3248838 RepID=UPI003B8FE5BB